MHSFITVIGNIATGKSTTTKFLADSLHAHHGIADELYKTNPFFQDAVVDRNRWSLSSDLWFLLKRVEITKSYLSVLPTKPIVQDSGILMSWVYANSRISLKQMNENEIDLYNQMFQVLTSNLPKESLVIYISLPIETLKKRIKIRNREFEVKYFTDEYLRNIELSIQQLITNIQKQTNVLTISESNWYDIVNNTQDQQRLLTDITKLL
jgi:deoxyguanosine kinase